MNWIAIGGVCAALLAAPASLPAQEPTAAAAPGPEQAFLQQLTGEWETEGEIFLAPGQPPLESTGTESIRTLGELWAVSEVESAFMGIPFSAVFTLGYDPETKRFVGTWVDSASSHLWSYEGTLDASGRTLTLEKVGPCVRTPGKDAQYRDVIALESDGGRTLTSRALIDGEWETMLIVQSRRKE